MNFYRLDILPKIGALIKRKRLTDSLELLEALGYSVDSSIVLLGYSRGVVA